MNKIKIDINLLLPEIDSSEDKCIDRLIATLNHKNGIDEVHLTEGEKSQLCIHYDGDEISGKKIRSIAHANGAKITDRYKHLLLDISGIRHSRHARIVGEFMQSQNGILEASASTSGPMRIEYDSQHISVGEIYQYIKDQDLVVKDKWSAQDDKITSDQTGKTEGGNHKEDHHHDHNHGGILGENTELYFAIISGVFWLSGLLLGWLTEAPVWSTISLYGAAILFGGYYTLKEAIESIKIGNFEIDFLMLVAAAGAIILGSYQEAALLLFLFSLGHALEHYAMNKARKSISALSDLAPPTALLKEGNQNKEVPIEELKIGDIITVPPHTKIAADGIIVSGNSSVDQSSITGESIPVDKSPTPDASQDDELSEITAEHRAFSGTVNGSGTLEVRVMRKAKDSTLSKLITLVNDAEAQKSPTQLFTDRFERYFVPAVIGLVILLLGAFLVIDEPFSASFYRAMAVLVAASPCALAISTPSAVLAAVARAAQKGVIIKGGGPLEHLGNLKAIAFDKTGTLTEGKPKLTDVIPLENFDKNQLLKNVVSTEELSDHPLARAIVAGGKEMLGEATYPEAQDLKALTARGVSARIDAYPIHIGNRRLMEEVTGKKVPDSITAQMNELESRGKTAMIVHYDKSYIGIIAVMDIARKEAKQTLEELKKIGISEMIMLTGDHQKVADAVAAEIGITDPLGNLLPEDKVESIERLKKKYGKVTMVGDGVNDAPAMARSTVGIAMGAAGSDVALETADIALMSDTLSQLPFVIGLSNKASRVIKQNLWMSLGMVAILVPLTITGIAEIGPAVIAHEGSTLLVVGNALRLLAYGKK